MNVDLTPQFVDDFEELRRQVENPDTDIERLKARIGELEQTIGQLAEKGQAESAAHLAELEKVGEETAKLLEALKNTHAEELARRDESQAAASAEAAQKVKAAQEAMTVALANMARAQDEELQRRTEAEKTALARQVTAKPGPARDQSVSEIEDRIAELAYVPLGMRVAALVLDVLFVALASATLRYGTGWRQGLPDKLFIMGIFVFFSLRAFLSPGNRLLGISARHIGPDHTPDGPVGIRARFVCSLLHYGPLVATAVVAASDEATAKGLMNLVEWVYHPFSGARPLVAVLNLIPGRASVSLSGAILASTLVWWGLLLLAIAVSSLIHQGTPYFRNTTLVESMLRVGFRRFSPPSLDVHRD